ncbi:MAG: hypothetical protein K2H06_02705 [Anaeroplasmataceae bacterium]|nr:hypothetical protein [Anaeroplasmataceae bacterium]
MRKIIIAGIIILCVILVFTRSQEEKEIRVRIIPNSDEASDLKVKEKAKDITVCYLKEAYDEEYSNYLKNLKQTLLFFECALEKELKENVEVELGNHTLYNKT